MSQPLPRLSPDFFESILDLIAEHIVVIDRYGVILYVNRAWIEFAIANGLGAPQWIGENYLYACDRAVKSGDISAGAAADSIKSVINDANLVTNFEYQCHSPNEQRWFSMRTCAFVASEAYVISHRNITERKLAEDRLCELTSSKN